MTRLADGTPSELVDQLNLLLSSMFGGKDVRIRFGASSATWSASATSNVQTVNHGIGRTPAVVGIFNQSFVIPATYYLQSVNATQFTFIGKTTTLGNSTGTQSTFWVAFG